MTHRRMQPQGQNANRACSSWLGQRFEALTHDAYERAQTLPGDHDSKRSALINGYSVHDSAVAIHALRGALLAGQFETSLNLCLGFAAAQPQDKTAVYLHLILPTISR
ncbi:MAG: hypothetical protein LAT78_01585, partial [Roseinatronobacter sp.]|nr:hypothetical protein [Roseinatronobacter sp.]